MNNTEDDKPGSLKRMISRLREAEPAEFVRLVRANMRQQCGLARLCEAAGSKFGIGVSMTRAIGNLSEKLHGKERRNEYLAAFFEPPNA